MAHRATQALLSSRHILPQPEESPVGSSLRDAQTSSPLLPAPLAPAVATKPDYEVVTFPKKSHQQSTPAERSEEEEYIELEPLPDHLITTYSPHRPSSSSPSATTKHQQHELHPPDAKYLTFLPHSGFHNQRSELENALVLARLLNRTLIMPKVYLGPPMPWLSFPLLHDRLLYQTKIGLERCRALIEHRDVEPLPDGADDSDQGVEEDDVDEDVDVDENGVEGGEVVEIVDAAGEVTVENVEPIQENSQDSPVVDTEGWSAADSVSREEQVQPDAPQLPNEMQDTVVERINGSLQEHPGGILNSATDVHDARPEGDSVQQGEVVNADDATDGQQYHRHHHHQSDEQRQEGTDMAPNPVPNLMKRSLPEGQRPFVQQNSQKAARKKRKQVPPKNWIPLPAECLQYESWTMTDWDLFFNLDPLRRYVRLASRESISMTYLQKEFGLSIPLEEQKKRPPKSPHGASSSSQDGNSGDEEHAREGEDADSHDDQHGTGSEDDSEPEKRPLLRPLGDVLFFEDTSLYDYRFTEDPRSPESLKTQSKFLQEFTVDWLAQRPERLIHLGSIFGAGRVSISRPESKAWLQMVREHLILQTEILQRTSQQIADRMAGGSSLRKKILKREMEKAGHARPLQPPPVEPMLSSMMVDREQEDELEDESGFVGIHIRMSDGHFSLSARKTIENIRKELLWQMGVQDPLNLEKSEASGDDGSQQEYQDLQQNQESQQVAFQQPRPNPTPVYAEKRFSIKQCRRMSLKHWSTSLTSSAAKAASFPQGCSPLVSESLGWNRSQGIQTPIFLATDAHNPRGNPIFGNLFATFDCLFTLDDFREELEELEQFRNPDDGVRLAPFLIPMIDAMVVAKAGAFFGTPMSTFSNYITRQLRPAYTGIHM
ncbi:hypothetical protein DFQ27_006866 [Actinomortierella ambigua]|uniref:Uncharacterized protein n=1 Tax=Actinomortierella ambigua TaxID=1343610 RepID=A0A9P6UBS3_9FUNG|nr:hypothetical protein DFQ27_006866 [Actinomortierella ambigua]